MKNKLSEFLGCEVKLSKPMKKLALPIFMTIRDIRMAETYGVTFAIVDIVKETELSVAAMKKQKERYEEALQCPVVYKMNIDSVAMRNALVKSGIPFIDSTGNVFLPFLGIVLLDVYRKKNIKTDKMMPATQLAFLELLYMGDEETVSKSKLAQKLNLTKTSITRATTQLAEMGLLVQTKTGTEVSVERNMSRRAYYEKAKERLINPIQKAITIRRQEDLTGTYKAGESALSILTSLNPPIIEERAIYKGAKNIARFVEADARYEDAESCISVQLWKYDPALFAKEGHVDPVSLACTFEDNEDERIEMCVENLLEGL
ncbi:MAG: hypothetical protein Q4C65_04575 [Eubacteriales bacterium]|nr:hypothetical protein [Eubacteriales bacterium]